MTRLEALQERASKLASVPAELLTQFSSMAAELDQSGDPLRITWQLDQVEACLVEAATAEVADQHARQQSLRTRVLELLPALSIHLTVSMNAGDLANHLEALHRIISEEQGDLHAAVQRLLDKSVTIPQAEADTLQHRVTAWSKRAGWFTRWGHAAAALAALREALDRLGNEDALGHMRVRTDEIVRSMRAILAQVGIAELPEIGRFESEVVALEQAFQLAGQARKDAYSRIANALCTDARTAADLPLVATFPPYDPADDAMSFNRLFQALALIVSRALGSLALQIAGQRESREAKSRQAALTADIRGLAKRFTDPARLIVGSPPSLRPDAVTAIQDIRRRVAQETARIPHAEANNYMKSRLIALLAASPSMRTDFQDLMADVPSHQDMSVLLWELAALQKTGVIRILIDIPPSASEDEPGALP